MSLNLYKPSVDDEIEESIVKLAENFQRIDDSYDEVVSDLNSHLKSGELYQAGKKFWNRTPSIGGYVGNVNIRTGVHAKPWSSQKTYAVGDLITSILNNGHYYQCISSGTSAVLEPELSSIENSTTMDISMHDVWQESHVYNIDDIVVSSIGDKSYYYKCLVNGLSGTVEPNWINVAGSTVNDGAIQWYVYKTVIWKEMGISCRFEPFGKIGV